MEQGRRLAYPIGAGNSARSCMELENPKLSPAERMAGLLTFPCNELGYDLNCMTISFGDTFRIFGIRTFCLEDGGAEYACPGQVCTVAERELLYRRSVESSEILEQYLKALQSAKTQTEKPISVGTFGPFTLAAHLMGAEELMIAMVEEPEKVHALVDTITGVICQWNRKIEQAGGEFVWVAEPVAVMISPEHFHAFVRPYLRRIFSSVSQAGFLHIPGNTTHLLKEFCETGAQCLSLDHQVGMLRILKTVPKDMVILGDIDSMEILDSTPDRIEALVKKLCEEVSEWPNVIISSGGGISGESPYENIEPIVRIAHTFPCVSLKIDC